MSLLTSTGSFVLEEGSNSSDLGLSSLSKKGAIARTRAIETAMNSLIVSDLDIQALVDGELNDSEKKRVLAALRQNNLLKIRYEQLLAQKRLIAAAWSAEQSSVH